MGWRKSRALAVLLWASLLHGSCGLVPLSMLVLRKCCPQDQRLLFTAEGANCTHVPEEDRGSGDGWWLPRELVSNDTRSLLQVSYGSQPDCDASSMDLLRFDLQRNMVEFALVSAAEGGMRLAVLKESTLHDPGAGRDQSFPPQDFCLDVVGPLSVAILCPCKEVTCVRKCCHDGRVLDSERGECVELQQGADFEGDFFDWVPKVDSYSDYYRLVSKLPKCDRFTSHTATTRLNESQLLLARDGTLQDLKTGEVFQKDEYCGAHSVTNEEMLIICLKMDTEAATKQIVYGSIFLVGAICLLATVLITAILPEMRKNLQGKMALAHNAMLFIGYLATGISQLKGSTMSQSSCEAFSMIIQFSILAAIFWLNVMCIDVSWSFSGLKPLKSTCLQSDRAKFNVYSLYAWGSTATIILATIIVENVPSITRFKPKFGTHMCFFNDREAELLFFFGPMGVILVINLILFVYIACRIFSANKQMKANSNNKKNVILYGKLFILMGVTWLTEVISWAVGGPTYFWYFTDLINLLRAVFIFVIFCCKRSVYVLLRNKVLRTLGKNVPDQNPSHSTKSFCSNDSGKRAFAVVNVLANTERDSPATKETCKRVPGIGGKSMKTDTIEMA